MFHSEAHPNPRISSDAPAAIYQTPPPERRSFCPARTAPFRPPAGNHRFEVDECPGDFSPTTRRNPPTGLQPSLLFKLKKLDRRPVLHNKSDGHARRGRVWRNQYLFPSNFSREIVHFKRDMRNRAHKLRHPRFSFEPHPLDSIRARLISRHERRTVLDQPFTFSALVGRNSDVVVPPRRTDR